MTILEKYNTTKHFYAVWFSNGNERTAKLIVNTEQFPFGHTSVSEYSRLFPLYEAPKMKRLLMNHPRETWEQAWNDAQFVDPSNKSQINQQE